MSYINNVRMFVRVFELGSMSAAARDMHVSPAVASSRIGELEKHLGIRLFNRTTRTIQPTEQGSIFYPGARKMLEAMEEAEAAVHEVTNTPRGSIFISAPLGIGRRLIAPLIPEFHEAYPEIHVRLRLSDRPLNITGEGLDLAFILGQLPNSEMRLKNLLDCPRVLCASPAYLDRRGEPKQGADLQHGKHDCLLLQFPGSSENRWVLQTVEGKQSFAVGGPFTSDDGDVLVNWALEHHGIINAPLFDVVDHLLSGDLVSICTATPPSNVHLACLFPHRRYQDPKIRLFLKFVSARLKAYLKDKSSQYAAHMQNG
ncbi:transcriptional regulator, LysR family protein [Pseudovibrio sp. FO-BEG1]|uniref:LysR family transcriptional regulator n=1 Tax=Pseudovibrio sp. (strain FO-BEG1) TaxID=911045 RepID=UPI000238D651|nr:LysR family transcriptional regulator [Pseudovibrio sp. FO-BEG1]AEV35266.1 transcriptional regulator, LysR family protein [Pseudovibrio sp. FO-BEG1]